MLGEIEPPRPRSPRIHHELRADALDQLTMGVAVHTDVGVIGRRHLGRPWPAQLVPVPHVDAYAVDLEGERLGQTTITGDVAVPEDRLHRRDQCELVKDLVPADIARVEDAIDPREDRVHLGPQEPVGVRDQADPDHRPHHAGSPVSPSPQRGASVLGTPRWSRARATTKSTSSSMRVGRW